MDPPHPPGFPFLRTSPNRGVFFYYRHMSHPNLPYNKPPLTESQLVDRLHERGLEIQNRERAERYLRHIGYYRLSPYSLPFQDREAEHRFRPDTSFDDVLHLYVFDRELRLLVVDAIERIEVAVRAAISNQMASHASGGPFWYLERKNFADELGFSDSLAALARETRNARRNRRSREEVPDLWHYPDALSHYVSTYGTPVTPPSWLAIELLTLGQLQHLYEALLPTHRKAVAQSLGVQDPVLTSWLRSFVRVRNICAHHGRLWNRFLGVYPTIPTSPTIRWLSDPSIFDRDDSNATPRKRLYPVLVALQTILFTISPHSSWAARLRDLLNRHPTVPLISMGINKSWESDQFWQDAFKASHHRPS